MLTKGALTIYLTIWLFTYLPNYLAIYVLASLMFFIICIITSTGIFCFFINLLRIASILGFNLSYFFVYINFLRITIE